MTKRFVYDHGLPFNKHLAVQFDDCISRIKKNKAALIIIDGGVGEGKTTLLIHLMDYVNKQFNLPMCSLDKDHIQFAIGGEEFLKKLRMCYEQDLPCIGYDEAGDFNKRGSLTRFNNMLNRTFETFRAFKILVVMCLPSFHVIDQDLYDKNIPRLLIHCYDRGSYDGNFKGFSLYRMQYIKHHMGKLVVKPFAYDIVDPNLVGQFLDLDPERSKLLDKISTSEKLDIMRQSEVKLAGLFTYKELGEKLGRSTGWVMTKIKGLKIKPVRKIHHSIYWDEACLNRLSQCLEYDTVYRGRR